MRKLREVEGDMENGHGLDSPLRRSVLSMKLLAWLITVLLLVVDRSVADDSTGGIPSTGILCVSECATCPIICASPPPQTVSYSPNPPAYAEQHFSPPPPPPPPPPPSPTSYNYFTTSPPPTTKSPSDNIPSVSTPTTRGGYSSYPYYYFYASCAPPQLSLFITSLIFLGILTSSCLVPLLGMI